MRKTLLWVSLGLALTIWAGYQYFQYIDADYSAAQNQAKQMVLEQGLLAVINETSYFAGEENYFVFQGKDKDDEQRWVWVSEQGETNVINDKDAVSRDEIKNKALQRDGNAQIKRIVPGKLGERWVWEVFYYNEEEKRYYYLYYDFTSGDFLRSYRLNKSAGS